MELTARIPTGLKTEERNTPYAVAMGMWPSWETMARKIQRAKHYDVDPDLSLEKDYVDHAIAGMLECGVCKLPWPETYFEVTSRDWESIAEREKGVKLIITPSSDGRPIVATLATMATELEDGISIMQWVRSPHMYDGYDWYDALFETIVLSMEPPNRKEQWGKLYDLDYKKQKHSGIELFAGGVTGGPSRSASATRPWVPGTSFSMATGFNSGPKPAGDVPKDIVELATQLSEYAHWQLKQFIVLFYSRGIERRRTPRPDKLNKTRLKKRKEPIDEFWTLTLSDHAPGTPRGPIGERKHMKLHAVSGYIRRVHTRKGIKKKWVEGYMRGMRSEGVITKDYAVESKTNGGNHGQEQDNG